MCTVALAVTAAASVYQGYMAKQAHKRQADLYRRQATMVQGAAQYDKDRESEASQRRIAALKAGYASSGVQFKGTPTAVIEDQGREDALRLAGIDYDAQVRSGNLRFQAGQEEATGQGKFTASILRPIAPTIDNFTSKPNVTSFGQAFSFG